jgi:hypothetical protein
MNAMPTPAPVGEAASSLYDTDFHCWLAEHVRLLRTGRLVETDPVHLFPTECPTPWIK